ncbi:uncharacterized protein LAESUDRAFT_722057 [Laetiporus sulphureus 93-53]|uniref:Zn(2)-C6 fungal-type domain-containing protein n=1 Tax=Laetiporus sulphureus 93-53 TaxID=1314785 RepID=A0A165G6S3_9APHY|nr:uncharacterized protein LAESUDRAFT_722057 [Laetiporus sulphureus 93-53]KZT09905.1 hypothetical protein LAESUDRAFT_722057 [Laetiporus sulphureus 93-53]
MSSSSPLVSRPSRRRNAPLSCAECRRLKLKCSRQFPCSSCVKKGCAQICPDGSLTTGKGNRFVLANTVVLHEKINALANRVRQLEDALQDAYSHISLEPHPLLSEELLQIKRPLERETQEEAQQEPEAGITEAIDAVGSLYLGDSGHTKFFGTTANAWYLLQNEEGAEDDVESPQGPLPTDIPWLSHAFPFSTSVIESIPDIRNSLISLLPELSEVRRLAALYFKHGAWMYTPIPESEFLGTILPRFYELSPAYLDQDPLDSHRLAILYLVLAMGTLVDLEIEPLSPSATRYYQLGRAALSLDSVLEHQTLPAIQALILMCHFMFLSHVDGPRWALMGLAVKLALTLGLHRDGNKWNLNPEEAFKRRNLFYELYTYDSWQSLTFGRPPSLSMAFIDCQMPESPAAKTDSGEPEMSFAAWKHLFASRCQSVVHEQVFGARISSYRTVIELDKKVREFYLPPSLRVPGFGGAKLEQTSTSYEKILQGYCAFSMREITVFYMHRGFFATALQDNPEDPLGSKYAPSVLAAHNSACAFVSLVKSLHSQFPALVERMWFFFTHVFSCSIVLGAIPSKSPGMALARSALAQLDTAYSLFDSVSHNPRAAKVLPVLRKLKSRAEASMAEYHSRNMAPRNGPHGFTIKEDEELTALGGKTRLVSRKSPSAPSSPSGSNSQGGSSPRDASDQSPVQSVAPPVPEPMQSIQHGIMDPPQPWQTYNQSPTAVNGFGYNGSLYQPYAELHGMWQSPFDQSMIPHSNGHHPMVQQPMGLDVSAIQNGAYMNMDPTAASYGYMSGGGSPDGQMQQPDASWQNLWAQFNQA